VTDPAGFEEVRAELRSGIPLAVAWDGERILPVETLVAERAHRAPLWVEAPTPEAAAGLLGALEHGPEAVVVEIRSVAEVDRLELLLDHPYRIPDGWTRRPVVGIGPAGIGGRVLVDNPVHSRRVLNPRVAYVMTKMLETVDTPQPNTGWDVLNGPFDSNWGTGYDAQTQDNVPGWPMAAKTGTTNSSRQAWYVGYTPLYTGAVWLGRDVPQAQAGMYGGTDAGPILQATMEAALQGRTPVHFTRPAGIVQAPIDIMAPPWQVAKPGPLTPAPYTRLEWFVAGTQPTKTSPLWVQARVPDRNNGALWQAGCRGGPPVLDTFLHLTGTYGSAWARGIATIVGSTDWQQFLPIDTLLAVPTQSCQPITSPLAPFGITA
jgi:hypothetical protein